MEEKGMAYYLEDLNRVKNLSFEQLESWKSKYPYSQLVHFLMAKKYQLAGLTDDMNIFHRASYFAVDRDHFYERMTNSESESLILPNDKILEEEQPAENIQTTTLIPENISAEYKKPEEEMKNEERSEELPAEHPETTASPLSVEVQGKKTKIIQQTDQLSPFTQWLISLQPEVQTFKKPTVEIDEEILESENENIISEEKIKSPKVKKGKKDKKGKKKKKKEKKKNKLEAQIENSIIMKKEIVSEPLAKILAQQGHNQKAIEMYRKLSLIFPEKSSFFAAQIDKLNNSN